jgi:Cu-Zn family superoxide dismutase
MNSIAVINPLINNGISGFIKFHQCFPNSRTRVFIQLKGFKPNQTHAIHIHEFGDLTNGCISLGAHFNPDKTNHGSLDYPQDPRHAGDMINNIVSDNQGNVMFEYEDPLISIFSSKYNILGRSIVIHKLPDDLGRNSRGERGSGESLITGNAGERIACAVIGISKSESCQ